MMNIALFIPCAVCALLSCATIWALARLRPRLSNTALFLIGGLLPTFLCVAALTIGHLLWLRSPDGYSPLALLLYGWWFVWLNLAINLIAAALAVAGLKR